MQLPLDAACLTLIYRYLSTPVVHSDPKWKEKYNIIDHVAHSQCLTAEMLEDVKMILQKTGSYWIYFFRQSVAIHFHFTDTELFGKEYKIQMPLY